jgi:hypothetical protein
MAVACQTAVAEGYGYHGPSARTPGKLPQVKSDNLLRLLASAENATSQPLWDSGWSSSSVVPGLAVLIWSKPQMTCGTRRQAVVPIHHSQ